MLRAMPPHWNTADDDFLDHMSLWASCDPVRLDLQDVQRLLGLAGMSEASIKATTARYSDPAIVNLASIVEAIKLARDRQAGTQKPKTI